MGGCGSTFALSGEATPNAADAPIAPTDVMVQELTLDFTRLMKNPSAREVLIEYARIEHSEENLMFYESVQNFKSAFTRYGDTNLDDDEAQAMRREAKGLVSKFLSDDAQYALNLPSSSLAPFRTGLPDSADCAPNMFDQSVRIIYKAIERDTFMRFKVTDAARDLLSRIPRLAAGHRSGSRNSSGVTSDHTSG